MMISNISQYNFHFFPEQLPFISQFDIHLCNADISTPALFLKDPEGMCNTKRTFTHNQIFAQYEWTENKMQPSRQSAANVSQLTAKPCNS